MAVSHALTVAVADGGADIDVSDVTALYEVFCQVSDPRKPRGVRHGLPAVLTMLALAVLCGARNFRQAADRVAELPTLLLAAAGARLDPRLGRRMPPSRDTLRRLAESIDAAATDPLLCQWIATRIPPTDGGRPGLALDGKTVRASHDGDPADNVKLFSAMRSRHRRRDRPTPGAR
ncbi:transposase family protein [Micromonospora sp. NBC_01638]|uniref:transposase family protein n=1 Tax=Micromonospora sp. NBC_01638 TaxID=2975982 RepID=UPI00386655A2|nr:transposase family protein [Micromonospora sp. NBC_01638]